MSNSGNTAPKAKDHPLKNLVGPTVDAEDNEAREKLIGARVALLLRQPFFGNLATRLKLVNSDPWLPTLATDGRHFFYNARFVNMLAQKELMFGFGHEILHCVYDHLKDGLRQGNRIPQIYNVACDYCVNADLVKHNVGTKITTIEILHDTKYEDWCSEAVYDDIMKNVKKCDIQQLVDKLLDDHLGNEDDQNGGEGGDKGESEKDGNGRPKLTKEELDEIKDEFKEAIINAINNEPNAGNIPGNVKKMVKELTEPQMDWRELLSLTLTSAIKDDYTWIRPSRRAWHCDAVLPGMNPGEEVNIAIAIDTSGSISNTMLVDFLSEIQGCMESFTAYRLHVFCFDTQVHNPVTFTSDDVGDMKDYELGGFGGTDFMPIFDYLKETEIEFDRLIVFTDGYPYGSWGDPEYCDTLWIIHGDHSITAPFGTTTYYTDHLAK